MDECFRIILLLLIVFVILCCFIAKEQFKQYKFQNYSGGDDATNLSDADRSELPYRPIAECYLVYDNDGNKELIAQNHGHYIMFPGGGIDEGETPEQAAKREIEEEVGLILEKDPVVVTEVKWDWMPEWASNEKRKKRYEQFRGEHVYMLTGVIKKRKEATATEEEGDKWSGNISMPFDELIKIHKEQSEKDHPNTLPYRLAQKSVIGTVAACVGNNI